MEQQNFYQWDREQTVKHFKVDVQSGLSKEEVIKRQEKYGLNELEEQKGKSIFSMIFDQFKDFLILVLLAAALVSGAIGETKDAILIIAIVIVNAIMGVVQENKAEQSLAALKKLSTPSAKVIREGVTQQIPAKELVPGDIVLLDAGDYIPADGRLIETASLKIQESALTGESVPVDKHSQEIDLEEVPLGDRKNLMYMSSVVTYGRGKAVVTKTGMDTEIGKIAHMIQQSEAIQTPLQKRLEELGKLLGIAALAVCAIMFLVGVLQGRDVFGMFMTAVSLAVAAIPEGLPAIVTVVLALGVQRMIRSNAIIRKLPAVETLGSASVICSDKTGTLTQNKMTIQQIYVDDEMVDIKNLEFPSLSPGQERILETGLLCNDAEIQILEGEEKSIGDPTEVAFVRLAHNIGMTKKDKQIQYPRVAEVPFDSDRKLMTTVNKKEEGKYLVFTKGAPDVLLDICTKIYVHGEVRTLEEQDKEKIQQANYQLSSQAYRVLGLAFKEIDAIPQEISSSTMENQLIFIGLMGMIDPPREEVKDSVALCRQAGIKPVMITGDHKDTAVAIAKELGIIQETSEAVSGSELEKMSDQELENKVQDLSVYARVSPEHKVRIVSAWQKEGKIVAMTGDGVNDAPALKKADIGCAMGITGTDVAKEAAEMVLTDDNFATIVSAIEEGRGIYANIRKSIHFLLSCNIGEIIALFIATLLNWTQPLLPIHILWVNLVTDSLPALALGVDPKEKDIMKQKPRDPKASIFAEGLGFRIIYQGIVIGAITLFAFKYDLAHYGTEVARTMAFAVLGLSQLTHAINVRSERHSVFKEGIFRNKYLILAGLVSALLQVAVIFVPFLQDIFSVVALNTQQWLIVLGLALLPLVIVEIVKLIFRLSGRESYQ